MRTARRFVLLGTVLAATCAARGEVVVLDNGDTLEPWRVITAEGVKATLALADGADGRALRLDFDFESGAGFCVLRRAVDLPLPANYRFTLTLRGDAPPNNLEFKLVDPSGDNVWWVNRRAFEFPRDWRTLVYKARHFQFAWGPAGPTPLTRLGAIEIAIASATGGRGSLYLDRLTFEELPPPRSTWPAPVLRFSSAQTPPTPATLSDTGRLDWCAADNDPQPAVRLDFSGLRELGGLAIEWDERNYAVAYDLLASSDGTAWQKVATVDAGRGGWDYVPLPDVDAAQLRLDIRTAATPQGVCLHGLRILPPDFAESANAQFRTIAHDAPRGWYPSYFLDQQQPWTVVGAAGDDREALLDAVGAVELDKASARLEPFLWVNDRVITWADVAVQQSLADGYLPIPTVAWQAGDLELRITPLADGPAGKSVLLVRYELANRGTTPQPGALFVALRPFQVLPPWHELNITGGTAKVDSLQWKDGTIVFNGAKSAQPWSPPAAFGAATLAQGEIVKYLARGQLPTAQAVSDPSGLASGALRFDFDLAPGARQAVVLSIPFHDATPDEPLRADGEAPAAAFARALGRARQDWTAELSRVQLSLPPAGAKLVDVFRTTQAYILINADGPAIQPGSRTYERSWIRDGAITSTALLYTGHSDVVRAYLDWYAGFQFPSGKVPCVVDRRGPDPVPEHDSTGQFIYTLLKYYHFSGDRDFLSWHLKNVTAGVNYVEDLRRQRLTDEYRDGPPERRACYGLVPESISHEGYSAKPMHSYWDSFWVLRGLKDATTIAHILNRPDLEERFAALRDAYRQSLYDSLALAMQTRQIDFIPGCVELGDFDATSTATAVFPCGEGDALPEPAGLNTFERYYRFFCDRRDGTLQWENYTPYELRVASTFVYLGWAERAHELLAYFMHDMRPAAWNEWPEVVWRDPTAPRFVGDMPHTWVGSEFLNAVRSLFVYERERDGALVLAAGVPPAWLAAPGVSVSSFPTEYGRISYDLQETAGRVSLNYHADGDLPPGGFVWRMYGPARIASVTIDGHPVKDFAASEVSIRAKQAHVQITYER